MVDGSEDRAAAGEDLPPLAPAIAEQLEGSFGESAEVIARKLAEQTGQSPEQVIMEMGYMFSGPHPPPAMLAAYDKVQAGFADRIVRQGESQTAHRQQIERGMLDMEREDRRESRSQSRLGLKLGFVIVVIVLLAALGAIALDQPWVGGVLGVGDIALLAGIFVYGSRGQRSGLSEGGGSKPDKAEGTNENALP